MQTADEIRKDCDERLRRVAEAFDRLEAQQAGLLKLVKGEDDGQDVPG